MSDEQAMKSALKDAVKEGLKEWLNEKFSAFGRWSAVSLAALALAAIVYFILAAHGWRPPQ